MLETHSFFFFFWLKKLWEKLVSFWRKHFLKNILLYIEKHFWKHFIKKKKNFENIYFYFLSFGFPLFEKNIFIYLFWKPF